MNTENIKNKTISDSIFDEFNFKYENEIERVNKRIEKIKQIIDIDIIVEELERDGKFDFVITINPQNKKISLYNLIKTELALYGEVSEDTLRELEEKTLEEKDLSKEEQAQLVINHIGKELAEELI